MDIGSESYRGKFPAIYAQGTKPNREINQNERGPAGNFQPLDIVATGRFGGSRNDKPGRDSNPIRQASMRRERGGR